MGEGGPTDASNGRMSVADSARIGLGLLSPQLDVSSLENEECASTGCIVSLEASPSLYHNASQPGPITL